MACYGLALPLLLLFGAVRLVRARAGLAADNSTRIYGPCGPPRYPPSSLCNARQGDVVVGAVFPVHEWNYTSGSCSRTIRISHGFQRMEAFQWAVNKYKGSLNIGYDIRDSCAKDTHTRDEGLDFINVGGGCQGGTGKPISIVVGASSSTVSTDLTNLVTLFSVPQISYASTSVGLNDSSSFSNFYRVVPPDSFQVSAVVSLLRSYSWSYVSIVYTDDEYGRMATEALRAMSTTGTMNFTFCIGADVALPLEATQQTAQAALNDLIRADGSNWHRNASVVVVIAQESTAQLLLQTAAADSRIKDRGLTWIATDAWAESLESVLPALNVSWGLITFHPFGGGTDSDEFNQEFHQLRRENFTNHPFYDDIFASLFPECQDFSTGACKTNTIGSSPLFSPDPKTAFVIRATRLAIETLKQALLGASCPGSTVCMNATSDTGAIKLNLIKTALETLKLNDGGQQYIFNLSSRAFLARLQPIRYIIKNLVRNETTGKAEFYELGEWSSASGLSLNQVPRFNAGAGHSAEQLFTSTVPESICARTCGVGEHRVLLSVNFQCCWGCERCAIHRYAPNNTVQQCLVCPSTEESNAQRTGCKAIPEKYLKFSNPLAVLIMFFAVVGLIGTVVVATVFIKYLHTPLVMASSRELSACLLAGFFLAFLFAFAFVTKPSAVTCGMRRFGLGFTFSLCFAALLVKTNRISRVFNRKPGAGRPSFITPGWQLVFTTILLFVQVLILGVWLVLSAPEAGIEVPTANEKVLCVCKQLRSTGLAISLTYNVLLLLMCTFYGVRTRKIPENFNEAKFISFSMYTICAVWLAFTPAFFATNQELKTAMLGLPLVISMLSMLGFLFFPKVYIIVFKPECNVRSTARHPTRTRRAPEQSASGSGTKL